MLTDANFALTYSSGLVHEPKEFFTEALIESKNFDLGLGFFSSSGIRCLAYGFALFIANGGKMRVVINHILSQQDKDAIEKGIAGIVDKFEDSILHDVKRLCETLSQEDLQFFNCFSYLISIKRIEFVATISSKGGLGHDKFGIFKDEKGNRVAFAGSANFSQSAMEYNSESLLVFTSWDDERRVIELEKIFSETWSGDSPHLTHIPLEKVTAYIKNRFTPVELPRLLEDEINIRSIYKEDSHHCAVKSPLSERILTKIEYKEREPRFPFPEQRNIQIDAYNAWVNNNKQGIFAMATGSGKTVTALNCLLQEYHKSGIYKAIVVVPTKALALQWTKEVRRFNFQNVISTHTDKDWKHDLSRYTTQCYLNQNKNLVIVTTYATFIRKYIQDFVRRTKGIDGFIFIADEAHNLGSRGPLSNLPLNIPQRIGLSATPERVYDDVGSRKIYDFFNSLPPKYTFRFTMKQAIGEQILCRYNYFPIFVSLTKDEMEQYSKITEQLRAFIDPITGKYVKDAEMLLMKRKRIIHKAQNKKHKVAALLTELSKKKKLNYTFVFVPEGYEPDYAQRDDYSVVDDDIHIIDEYASMFKELNYSFHKYITGIDDAPGVLNSFANGDIQVLLSMKCLDEGVDIPRTENAIFISSTGNPRQFIQRRGRVLRKCDGKEMATIWDLIVTPPNVTGENSRLESRLFQGEVKRILNFAALAENKIDILYGELHDICMSLNIDMFGMLDNEEEQYKN